MDFRACSCVVPPQLVLCGWLPLNTQTARRVTIPIYIGRRKTRGLAVKATSSDGYDVGSDRPSMVDADMIVLRKRIYELKQQDNNYEHSQEWMEWEKKWHRSYDWSIFQAVEWLQFSLVNTRPSVGIALLSLFTLIVLSTVVVVVNTGAAHLRALLGSAHE